jgi:lipopolysaccharide export system protein LptA
MGMGFKSGRNREKNSPASVFGIITLLAGIIFFGSPQILFSASNDTTSAEEDTDRLVISAEDSGKIDLVNSSMEYNDNVRITYGETVITADNVIIHFKDFNTGLSADGGLLRSKESLEKFIASGNVRISSENGIATGEKAVYDSSADTLVITGNDATVVSAAYTLSAPELTVTGIGIQ